MSSPPKISEGRIERFCERMEKLHGDFATANINKKANESGPYLIKLLTMYQDMLTEYPELTTFIEGLGTHWVCNQNPRVAQIGLEALMIISEALQTKFRNYIMSILHLILNKMGDGKEVVRDKVRACLIRFVETGGINPHTLLEKLLGLINNKNKDMGIEAQRVIMETLIAMRGKPLNKQTLIDIVNAEKHIDNNFSKAESNSIIMEAADRLGRRLSLELLEKDLVKLPSHHQRRIAQLMEDIKYAFVDTCEANNPAPVIDPAAPAGGVPVVAGVFIPAAAAPAAAPAPVAGPSGAAAAAAAAAPAAAPTPAHAAVGAAAAAAAPAADAHDGAGPSTSAPRPAPRPKPVTFRKKTGSVMTRTSTKNSSGSGSNQGSTLGKGSAYAMYSGQTGVDADENWFLSAFDDVIDVEVTSARDFEAQGKKIHEDFKGGSEFWEEKLKALKKTRSMIKYLDCFEEELFAFIKNIALTYSQLLKDLRSQVVREACLTLAYICRELKQKTDIHMLEINIPPLMSNVISSAKVVASSSVVCLKFIYTYVHHGRIMHVLHQQMNIAKAKEIKSAGSECLLVLLQNWPLSRLESQISNIAECLKKGMNDGTSEGRMAARKAFWAFNRYFPDQGNALLHNMDAMLKKQVMALRVDPILHDAQTSTSSLIPPGTNRGTQHPRHPWMKGSQTSTSRQSSTDNGTHRGTPVTSGRSNSAIDLQAAQRAKARQQYAALARQKVGSGASLPRPKKTDSSPMSGNFGAERVGRTRSRVAGVSQSQPSSRSGSPSSRLGYHTYNMPETNTLGYQSRRVPPRSQGTSRETSPNRFGSKSSLTNLFGSKRSAQRPPIQPMSRPVMAQKILAQSLEAENSPLSHHSDLMYDGEPGDSLGHKVSPRKTSYRPFEDHSDDSDASSLCSERSFDSYRRTSDDISEIIANCESTQWTDRKEGLVGLQAYLHAGSSLNATELKRITDCFTGMFMDSHTKVFSLFLDTLNELILMHRADLNSWLYVLLTRLLNKLGGDLLGSIQNKIIKSLDVIRESFPPELQMSSVLRFLTDPTQTPGPKVKTAALNYLTKLAAICDPQTVFPPSSPSYSKDPLHSALHKMIGWTIADGLKHGNELRRAAQEAILALFNLNPGPVTMRLAKLPQEYQEAAGSLLKGRVRRSSVSSPGNSTVTSSPPSPSTRMASPGPQRHFLRSVLPPDTELNSEEIYKSLRKTTAEIQNYTYETGTEKPPDKDNTTSKDSGISQLSGTEALEEAMEELSLQSNSSVSTLSSTTSTTLTSRVLTVRDCNGVDAVDNTQSDGGVMSEDEALRKVVESLTQPDSDNGENVSILSDSEKRASLGQLTRLIRDSSVKALQDNFRPILRILLGNLTLETNNRDVQTKILTLTAFTELLKKRAITESFTHFTELVILKVLNCYKDNSKEVVRSGEACANMIATTLPPEAVIRVLTPLIQTGEFPLNLAAIKMLTKLVDACGRDPIMAHLPDLMPPLIQAYDNQESSVRKSAVFCMVSLHAAIGEEDLKPHLAALNGSKLKLLHLYIRRSQQGSSAPTSPRNHPPAS